MDTIYYDRDDDDMDGLGWNVVSNGGSIAARFATKDDAVAWCEDHGVPYELVHGQCDCGDQYTLGADDHCGECGSCWGCCGCVGTGGVMKTKDEDIVTRLRMQDANHALQEEAADEIERLRAEAALWKRAAEMYELGDITFAERLVDEARRG